MTTGKSEKKDTILKLAKKRLEGASEADKHNRDLAIRDLRFLNGDQWQEQVLLDRKRNNRPALTFNRLPGFLDQLVGDLRQNKISIKVLPVDDSADKQTAEILGGLIKNIETQSNASQTYITAGESAMACGFGALRIVTDYADHNSFDQELFIEPIKNPMTVYIDPRSTRVDASDAKWAAITIMMEKEEFEKEFPNANHTATLDTPRGDEEAFWYMKDSGIRVAEYFWIEEIPKTIYLLSDGTTICCKRYAEQREELEAQGIYSVKERKSSKPVVMYAKISSAEILEGPQEWPSEFIPIVPFYGKELNVNGKTFRRGAIRNALAAQEAYNYMRTGIVEHIGKQPHTTWLVTPEQIEGYQKFWESSNSGIPYLPYNWIDGHKPPSRIDPPQGSPAMSQEAAQMSDEMKSATHLFDSSLGNRSNETSGVAIRQRQSQGERGNFAFYDNYAQSIQHVARILLDMIPRIYDTPRIARIIGPDEEGENIPLRTPIPLDQYNEAGEQMGRVFDPSLGRYDVVATVGPSTATANQESTELMLDFLEKFPGAAPVVGDLLVKNMSFRNAEELEKRLRFINPYIQQQEQAKAAQEGGVPPGADGLNPQGIPPGAIPPGALPPGALPPGMIPPASP
ncbi:MAG: hypothetical protein OEZ32_08105 [Nitrospinota bacterium]|nr:hypothetical protein [Nitrospinota bacterium]